jgi:predicted HD superfamily hydrolase involved in NAD metabolism
MRHGLDARKARIAGLLHDIARLYSPQRMIEECAARGIQMTPHERESPVLLHAALGAELARERFGVSDADVLSAIKKHTNADSAMSPLDCVVYLADSLEPQRGFPERERLWRLAQRNLDAAMAATLEQTVTYLNARGLKVANQTIEALRYFNEGERRAG